MRATLLKIKIKSLAAETKIIRHEERRALRRLKCAREDEHEDATKGYQEIYLHRIKDVRRATRETLLAYGFLRRRRYAQLEGPVYSPPDWKAVAKMIRSYGDAEHAKLDVLNQWLIVDWAGFNPDGSLRSLAFHRAAA